MFQSLSGFPMSCNIRLRYGVATARVVSIPIGFSNELQLRGTAPRVPPDAEVSIPIGFSNELQHRLGRPGPVCRVSIPIGFSNELQLVGLTPARLLLLSQFQSLSGFPMSCNVHAGTLKGAAAAGFQSLSGFPMSCNQYGVRHRFRRSEVSIPIGFSNELQLLIDSVLIS